MNERLNKSHKELIESWDYVDNIIESMTDALAVINPDGKVRTVNKAIKELLGYMEDEIIGNDASFLFPEEELFRVTKIVGCKFYQTMYQAEKSDNWN